ncbi:MAG: ribonuclease H [Longimicrobiales bacterium]
MSELVYIHTDESCLGNQFKDRDSPGAAAGLVELWRETGWVRRDFWTSEPGTTNNRMALQSAIIPLRALKKPCTIRFTSDSQYLVKGMTEWIHGWKARGWKRRTGEIENVALWQELASEAARHTITWHWVKGHAGHPQNEYANHLATSAARDQDATDGLVKSQFVDWLNEERERNRYMDFMEFAPPKW